MVDMLIASLPSAVCVLLGMILIIVEVFLPGFGLPGISGVVLQVITVTLTWINHGPMAALGMTLIVLSVDAIAISLALHSATKGKLSKSKIILRDTENNAAGYRSNKDMEIFLGKEGVTTTVLRPTGMAEFDGVRLNVVSEGDFIENGTKIRVTQIEGSRIVVKKV